MAEKKPAEYNKGDSFTKKTIVFLHPDLGIGGAERLVVDAAVGLQNRGNKVVIFTSHCDPKHCFDEARDGTFISLCAFPSSSPSLPSPLLPHPVLSLDHTIRCLPLNRPCLRHSFPFKSYR